MPTPLTPAAVARSCLALLAGLALLLAGLDRLPALLAGAPQGARVFRTVEEAEAALGAAVWLPASVPPAVAWPPARVDVWPGPPLAVAVHFAARERGGPRLTVVESVGRVSDPPRALRGPAEELMTADPVRLGRHDATVTRALGPDGQVLHDVRWDQDGRRIVLRYAGPVEDLMRAAGSLERTHR
jgi:hypothetical protein